MKRKLINLKNKKFGRLTVVERVFDKPKKTRWLCRCECGKETIVYSDALRREMTKSCGCYNHSNEWKDLWEKAVSKLPIKTGENTPNWKGGKDKIICVECGKEFFDYKVHNRILCSKKCASKYQGRQKIGENSHFWKGGKPFCKDCGKQLTHYVSERCIKCAGIYKRIDLCPEQKRNCNEYVKWRKSVYERDNHKCRIYNKDCNGRIEAHHILSWSQYPELRYEINNGITLCRAHHPFKRAEENKLISFFQKLVKTNV